MHHKQADMLAKFRDILGENFTVLSLPSDRLEEDFESSSAKIACRVDHNGESFAIESTGTGLVDALFNGLKTRLATDFPSLNTIGFHDFSVKGIMSTRTEAAGSDAEAEVSLSVVSSEGVMFRFNATSRSTGRASVDATLQAVAFFVNSEKAFIEIYNILQHYRNAGRADLVTKYQDMRADMVGNTSYTEVIQQIKQRELDGR